MIFRNTAHRILKEISKLSAKTILLVWFIHLITSYAMMLLCNEPNITNSFIDYLYYYITTSSTVGYGDISPETNIGKLIASAYLIPFSLATFTLIFSKATSELNQIIRNFQMGLKSFHEATNHIILIVGNRTQETKRLVDLILADDNREDRPILIVTKENIEHPYQKNDKVGFCKVNSFNDDYSLNKIAINKATKIIVNVNSDNENFKSTVHFKNKVCSNCRIVTYIQDEDIACTLRELDDKIEVISARVTEQLVRAMQDEGSSIVTNQLLTSGIGQTLFVSKLHNNSKKPLSVDRLKKLLENTYGALFFGIAENSSTEHLLLNPDGDLIIDCSHNIIFVHYINNKRINELTVSD